MREMVIQMRSAESWPIGKLSLLVVLYLTLNQSTGRALGDAETLYRQFRDPPKTCSLMPYWFWNGKITAAESRRQMREMIGQGVWQAVVFPWNGMEPKYLSEEYWRMVGAALDGAAELGFTLNFADEYCWPSGHAWESGSERAELSRVLQTHPEFRMRRLALTERVVQGPGDIDWQLEGEPEAVVAAQADAEGRLAADSCTILPASGRRVLWRAPAGRWILSAYRLVPAVGGHNTRVDLLNSEATRVYLDLVYEEYARRFPRHLGTTLRMTVADHEGAYGAPIAYTPRLWDEFKSRQGYDLRRYLPLLGRRSGDERFSRQVRRHYFEVVSSLYVNSFTRQVTDWCSRHGLKHATSLYEEQLYFQVTAGGDMFEQWRTGTAVFIDALLERARMPIDFKEAVSVAHFDRKPLLVENQGLQGHASFFSLEKARLGSNMALLWGAERLVPYFDYDPLKIQWPPQWFLGQPLWRCFGHYSAMVNRAQYMNSQGSHVSGVLLYYPRETAFANSESLFDERPRRTFGWNNVMDHVQNFYSALELELSRGGWDYHVVDSRYLERAEVRKGELRLADEAFRVLILPPLTDMDESARRQVRRFVDAGGVVLAVGQLPEGLEASGIRVFPAHRHPPFMDRLDYLEYLEVPSGIRAELKPLLGVLEQVEPPQAEILSEDRERIYFSHRRQEHTDWYWVVNDTQRPRQVAMHFPCTGRFEKWDAETGDRWALPVRPSGSGSRVELRLGPHDGFFVIRHEGSAGADQTEATGREETVLRLPESDWRFTPEAPRLEVPYAQIEGETAPLWLAPERMAQRQWWLIGPFPYDDHQGFIREYPPEHEFNVRANYRGAFGEVAWRWCTSGEYMVRPREALGLEREVSQGVYYALTHVWSPVARRARISVAFADSIKAWWNDELVLSVHRHPKWLLLRDSWAETRAVDVRQGWNTVRLKIGPSYESQTAFLFRLTDESGATLRDLVYARERGPVPNKGKGTTKLMVAVPPGAVNLDVPAMLKPFRLEIDGKVVHAAPGATVALPARARSCVFDVERGDEPERPVRFGCGTVPFALQCWTDSALAHYSGTAIYETDFELPGPAIGKRMLLDLGEVGLAAEVWVNGHEAGVRAWRPFRIDVSRFVRPGRNSLRIRVANSNAGWLAQGGTIYAKGSWGMTFDTERDRLATIRPNGLEGPIRILRVHDPDL